METKSCSKCREIKPVVENFGWRVSRKRYQTICNSCLAKRKAELRSENPEGHRNASKQWREKNPHYNSDYHKKWYETNKSRKNTETAEWRANNRERHRASSERWRKENPERYHAYQNRPDRKVIRSMRAGMHRCLKRGEKNGRSWMKLVGYTRDELMLHLENLFKPGMTWENYGKGGWHIDHVIPLIKFDITDAECEEFRRAWALENLQPLWEAENLSKHDKILT